MKTATSDTCDYPHAPVKFLGVNPVNFTPQESCSETSSRAGARHLALIVTAAVIVTGLALRLIGLTYPPFDAHAYRQTETLSTIDAFYRHGIDLFHPSTIYMGDPGTFVLEFPVFQALAASLYDIFGPHLEIIRLLNILFGAGTVWLLYLIARRLVNPMTALLAFWIYWLAPLNILYQRSMLLDPMAVFCAMVSFYCLLWLVGTGNFVERRGAGWLEGLYFTCFAVATWLAVMTKALYLWPTVLLFGRAVIVRRFKPDSQIAGILAVFAISGICFLFWNKYAGRVNDASPFVNAVEPVAGGVRPTSHLGFSALLSREFYYVQLIHRPKLWLGVFGAILYPIGLLAAWKETRRGSPTSVLWLLIAAPPAYLLVFANINTPHEFYQLIITPFLAIISGYGLWWLGLRVVARLPKLGSAREAMVAGAGGLLIAAAVLTYCVWLRAPSENAQLLRFQQLCAGKFEPWSPAMLFVSRDIYPNSSPIVPEFLYAAKLWGYARLVDNAGETRPEFETLAPVFPQMEFVVFYGIGPPQWLPQSFHLDIQDDRRCFYVFQRVSAVHRIQGTR